MGERGEDECEPLRSPLQGVFRTGYLGDSNSEASVLRPSGRFFKTSSSGPTGSMADYAIRLAISIGCGPKYDPP